METGNKKSFLQKLRDARGQSTIEYILILAVVVLIALKFKEKVGGLVSEAVDKVGTNINEVIEE